MAEVTLNTGLTADTLQSGISENGYDLGIKITVNSNNTYLKKVTKLSGDDVDTCTLFESDRSTEITSATFSGNDATFNEELTASTTYYIMNTRASGSGTWGIYRDNSVSFPVNGTEINMTAGAQESGDDGSRAWSITSVVTEQSTGTTVSPSTLTLSTTNQSPSYFIDVTSGPVSMTASVLAPGILGIPTTVNPNAVTLSASVLDPTIFIPTSAIIIYPITISLGLQVLPLNWDNRVFWTSGERGIETSYPNESGLIAETTKQTGRISNLIYKKSFVSSRNKAGL